MIDPAHLRRIYQHSRLNRPLIVSGTQCRCFHCLGAFPAEQVCHWTDDGNTARCPNCGVDAVLSSTADPLSDGLILELQAAYFGSSKKFTDAEWRAASAEDGTRRQKADVRGA